MILQSHIKINEIQNEKIQTVSVALRNYGLTVSLFWIKNIKIKLFSNFGEILNVENI